MKSLVWLFSLLVLLGNMCSPYSRAQASLPQDSADDWSALDQQVSQRLQLLQELIQSAADQQLVTDYAEGSVHVIRTFRKAARHDYENVERVREIFRKFRYYEKLDPRLADQLAFRELRDCLRVADHAINELKSQLAGKVVLSSVPDLSQGKMVLGEGHYVLEGRPVYPYTMVWSPEEEEYIQHYGRITGEYYSLAYLTSKGEVPERRIELAVRDVQTASKRNLAPYVIFNGNSPARWMVEKHPEITQGARHFTRYDIDSPVVRSSYEAVARQLLSRITAAAPSLPYIHLLANEPHFATAERGWWSENGISDYTMVKYRSWLKQKYSNIGELNRLYQTDYQSFDDVVFYISKNKYADEPFRNRQISKELRGGPVWYDWCRFNQERVNEWFTFLKETTQHNDGIQAPVTIKMLGFTLSRDMRDGGMDIEYLTKLQDISGADLRTIPQGAIIFGKHEEGIDPSTDWKTYFAYDWVKQAMYLDFSKSICPEKAFYDSEWHGLSAVSWRHFDLSRDYIRSALWMAFMDGMSLINPWVWGRDVQTGALKNNTYGFVGELPTQPIALDAYARVMKELNVHAEWLAPGVQAYPRHFMVYYCEEASIQDVNYTQGMTDVYQAVKLLNKNVGFTTPSEISRLDVKQQTVLVSPTSYISDASLKALEQFQGKGGRIILIGASQSFSKNELGQVRDAYMFQGALASVQYGNWSELIPVLKPLLQQYAPEPEIVVSVQDQQGEEAFGVIMKFMKHPVGSYQLLILNNISNFNRKIQLPDTVELQNILSGVVMDAGFEMKPNQVMVLKIN